jgi:hypothetical protein
LFQSEDADRISDALSRAIKQTTETTLISDTPTTENMLTTEDVVLVVLKVLVVLNVLLTVLNIDDSTVSLQPYLSYVPFIVQGKY